MTTLGYKIDRKSWGFPTKTNICGLYVDLEPLSLKHLDDLWEFANDAPDSFAYLRYGVSNTKEDLKALITDLSNRSDQPFWAVTPKGGVASGWMSICDIYQEDGSIEIGSIWFSPKLQGTKNGREAIFLLMCIAMDDLEYERLVWRCHAQNEKSFRAAENLGFKYEGTWRRAMVVSGWQRDVAWFSILRDEWLVCRSAFEKWLSPDNFDERGTQLNDLKKLRTKSKG